jgi:hypothetical protein
LGDQRRPFSGGPLSAQGLGPVYGPASRNGLRPYATVVLQCTNHGPTPRATAQVALGLYPSLHPSHPSHVCGVL